jgi:hypothetical protein
VYKLRTISEFQYPNLGTFKDALDVAREAIDKYGGTIPNDKAAEKLGYKIKDPKKISGPIYQRLGDLAMFGLFEKIRGGYKTTELAVKALDPYDSASSDEGKAEAIRRIPIIERAFTTWEGEIPQETAFPAKLEHLIEGISWKEAQNHAETLRNLFIEVFPYLTMTPEPKSSRPDRAELGGEIVERDVGSMTISAKGKNFGFTKTLPFTNKGIQSLRKLVEFLETQIEAIEAIEPTKRAERKDDSEKG